MTPIKKLLDQQKIEIDLQQQQQIIQLEAFFQIQKVCFFLNNFYFYFLN
jgi:hypothetical protein